MAVETATIIETAITSSGDQDFISSGFGTPQAAMFIFTQAYPGSNPSGDGVISIGFADGTREGSAAYFDTDAVGTSSATRIQWKTRVISGETGAFDAKAAFSAWVTDGVRINWAGFTPSQARYVTVVLFKNAVNIHVDSFQLTSTGINDITQPGFKPDLVLFGCVGSYFVNASTTYGLLSFGAAHNSASDTVSQGQITIASNNGQANAQVNSGMWDNSACGQVLATTQSWRGSAQDFDSQGFSINTSANPADDYIVYLAIELNSPDEANVSIIDTPITTGVQSYNDSGFTPGFLMLLQSPVSVINNIDITQNSMSIGVADNAGNQFCSGVSSESGVTDMNTQSNVNTLGVAQLYREDGVAITHEATLSAYTASGFDLDFSVTDSTPRKWLSVTLSSGGAPAPVGVNAAIFGANF